MKESLKMQIERGRLLKNSRLIFFDSKGYNVDFLVGYMNLVKDFCNDIPFLENSLLICGLKKDLQLLDEISKKVIDLYYIENLSLFEISKSLDLAEEEILNIRENALNLLRNEATEFSYIKIAKIIFIDSSSYNNKQLVGFCRLVKELVDDNILIENSISIKELREKLHSLDELYILTVYLYYFENLTTYQIPEALSLYITRGTELKNKSLNLLRKKIKPSFEVTINEALLLLKKDINSKITIKDNFEICDIGISKELKQLLYTKEIKSVSDLLNLTPEDLSTFPKNIIKEIKIFQEEFDSDTDFLKKKLSLSYHIKHGTKFEKDLPISVLNIDTRTTNSFKRRNINYISEFLSLSKSELKRLPSVGTGSLNKLIDIQKSLL